MPPKDKPNQVKAVSKGKQRAAGEKTVASDEGVNWLKEAWRRAGFTPFNGTPKRRHSYRQTAKLGGPPAKDHE